MIERGRRGERQYERKGKKGEREDDKKDKERKAKVGRESSFQ